jgi:hypothetical protein
MIVQKKVSNKLSARAQTAPGSRSFKLAAFIAFAGPLDLLTRCARRSSRPLFTGHDKESL